MIHCRACGGPAAGYVRVLVDDGAILSGRLRDRRLGPAKKRIPNSATCARCFDRSEVEFQACKVEYDALIAGGMSHDAAAAAMAQRRLAGDVRIQTFSTPWGPESVESFAGIDRSVAPPTLAGWPVAPQAPITFETMQELADRLMGPRRPDPEAA